MKPISIFKLPLSHFGLGSGVAMVLSVALLAGCSKTGSGEKAAASEKSEAPEKAGVTLDAETQERIGLKIETPAPAQWQPQFEAVGNVADPLAFTAAAVEYESARSAAAVSKSEAVRVQNLATQNNASARALEAAQAMAERDELALQAAQAKFAADWGPQLAAQPHLSSVVEKLQSNGYSLVKLSLPVGVFPNPLPQHATVFLFGSKTNSVEADFADDLHVAPATQTQMLLFSANKKLPAGISVTARLKTPGQAVSGVTVPVSAVLRHQGLGWVYVQTATNQFQRVEIPLDRLTGDGWFVSENLSATNRVVVTGAQTVLSAELSGGGFSTGQRD